MEHTPEIMTLRPDGWVARVPDELGDDEGPRRPPRGDRRPVPAWPRVRRRVHVA